MQYTTNYSLKKPQYADEADIEVINDNTDDVDTLIHQNRTMIAPAFDNTKAYVTGDPVEYLGALYVFTSDKAAGAWDASKVEPTTAAEMGGGGASALADLDDVEITSPTDGQALLFDDDDDVWKNQTLPDASVTKEATGNPIEITDAAAAPIVKCVTAITGSQDLHGYDKPWVGGAGKNKLPLVLADIKANNTTGTWNGNLYTWNGVTFEILTDSSGNITGIKATGTASSNAILFVCIAPDFIEGTSYILNGCPANGSTSTYRLQYSNYVDTAFNDTGDGVEFNEFSHTYTNRRVLVTITSGYAIPSGGLTFYPMIRLSTETDPTFTPYSNICPITAYTENTISVGHDMGIPIESGTINSNGTKATSTIRCRTGEFINLVANKNYKVIVTTTQSKTINVVYQFWTTNTFGSNSTTYDSGWLTVPFVFSPTVNKYCTMSIRYDDNSNISPDDLTVKIIEVEQESTTTYPSAIYRGSEDVVNGGVSYDMPMIDLGDLTWRQGPTGISGKYRFIASITNAAAADAGNLTSICSQYGLLQSGHTYNNETGYTITNGNEILIYDENLCTLSARDFKTAMAGVKLAYTLTTPTTTPVTPTNLPIKSLSGYTHIESSTGDMEIEYITKTYEPLVDLIEASDHIYSTQEQAVGTWVDGKTLYEQTLYLASASISSGTSASMPSISGVETVMVVGGSCYDVNDQRYYPLPYIRFNDTESIKIQAHVVSGSLATLVFTNFSTAYSLKDISVVIRYTKSSSNRSLSAPVTSQKSISEPLTDKTEEVPTEEEKTVEKPETEEETNETER